MLDNQGKTEKATPKRRDEARKKGQVAKSMELTTAFIFIAAIFMLRWYLGILWAGIQEYTYSTWHKFPFDVKIDEIYNICASYMIQLGNMLAPIFITFFIVALATSIMQVGLKISFYSIKPSLAKLNPISGFKRFFSLQPYVQLLQSLFKLTLLSILAYWILARNYPLLLSTVNMEISTTGAVFGAIVWEICWKMALALLLLGIIDMAWQKYQFAKSIRMTKQEIKDETKNSEGDPLIKSHIRKKQIQMARKRMIQAIPKADVVITNPIHFAIAIQYDAIKMAAPHVVAKGAGLLAEKIKELAREYNVPIVENPPLAQSLYRLCEVDDEIPTELYAAVSEVLVYVYRLTGKI